MLQEERMTKGLKPLKYPQGDLFVCDVTDVILKDDMASMEHPFYSLAKKPDREPRRYEHNGNWIEIRPSASGLPTIYDKDLIIYAISQLIASLEEGQDVPEWVEIDPYAFMVFTQRGTGGRDYDALAGSIDRIDGTRYRTNVLNGGTRTDEWFGIIDAARTEKDESTGKIKSIALKLSEMVRDTVKTRDVLTLHRDYFRLARPLERRLYEMARKSVGQGESWSFLMDTLHAKSGSKGSLPEFRRKIKPIIEADNLPDYMVVHDEQRDKITFVNRNTMPKDRAKPDQAAKQILLRLSPDVDEQAKRIAQGWDIGYVKDCFAAWWLKAGAFETKNADAIFLKFCHTWQAKRGRP